MAQEDQFIQSFNTADQDKDGEINHAQFNSIVVQLGLSQLYQGSVTKMIRKMNYLDPDKDTLNLEQAKQYFLSLEVPSRHEILKQKYKILETITESKNAMHQAPKTTEHISAAPGAAPAASPTHPEDSQNSATGRLNILVGNKKPFYNSLVDLQFEKSSSGDKSKPFIKLSITAKTNEKAKLFEVRFKETYGNFVNVLASEMPDWALEIKNIHINSFVKDCTTTLLITTSEEMVGFIQLIAQALEMIFEMKLEAKAHLQFQFDYDFEQFISNPQSSFYDIFTKDCRLSLSLNLLGFMRALRMFLKFSINEKGTVSTDDLEQFFPIISLIHLQGIDGEFQFQNSTLEEYEVESKEGIKQGLQSLGSFFGELQGSGIKFRDLLQLLEEAVQIEVNNGEWKTKLYLRLMNINKIFTQLTIVKTPQVHDQQQQEPAQKAEKEMKKYPSSEMLKKSNSNQSLDD